MGVEADIGSIGVVDGGEERGTGYVSGWPRPGHPLETMIANLHTAVIDLTSADGE